MTPQWTRDAARLAERLHTAGAVTDRRWLDAFAHTPRHRFLPGPLLGVDEDPGRLRSAYTDEALDPPEPTPGVSITPAHPVPVPPSVLARCLGHLDRDEPDGSCQASDGPSWGTVLQADLGDGYAAALLSHLLGPAHRERLVCLAEPVDEHTPTMSALVVRRLARIGCHPTVVRSVEIALQRGPYARILGGAVAAVPAVWIAALAPRGRLVARWDSALAPAVLALDRTAQPGVVTGRAHPEPGPTDRPVTDRHPAPRPVGDRPRPVSRHDRRHTDVDPALLADPGLRTLLALRDPTLAPPLHYTEDDESCCLIRADDHAFVELVGHRTGPRAGWEVVQGGPRRLWPLIEQAAREWHRRGRPGAARYGMTAHVDGTHAVWLDRPDHPFPDPATEP